MRSRGDGTRSVHDLLFRNALIFDGEGSPPAVRDVAVTNGRITAIGSKLSVSAREVIAADGLALMPGIIDNHTHYDAQITWDPWVSPSPALGVTTAVIGNCGFTIAPVPAADRELDDAQPHAGRGHVARRAARRHPLGVRDVPEYLRMLERQGAAVNIAAFVGHCSVRTYVMGDDATQARGHAGRDRADAGLSCWKRCAPAPIGFATSTSPAHNGDGGLPMPSRLADDDELRGAGRGLSEAAAASSC